MDPHLTQLAVLILAFTFAESQPMPGPPGANGMPRSPGFRGLPRPPGANGMPRSPGFRGLPPPPGPPTQRFQQQRRSPMSPAMRQLNNAAFLAAVGGNDQGKRLMAFEFVKRDHPCLVDQLYKSVAMEIADIPPMAAAGFRGDPMTAIAVQKLGDVSKRRAAMKAFATPCFKENPGLLSLLWDYADLPLATLAMRLGIRMGNPMGK